MILIVYQNDRKRSMENDRKQAMSLGCLAFMPDSWPNLQALYRTPQTGCGQDQVEAEDCSLSTHNAMLIHTTRHKKKTCLILNHA